MYMLMYLYIPEWLSREWVGKGSEPLAGHRWKEFVVYIYIYIYREREMCIYIYIEREMYVYIYIYI